LRIVETVVSISFRGTQKVPEIQMPHEVVFYETTLPSCQSGEAKILTFILGIDLPCSHQYSTASTRPHLPRDTVLALDEDIETSGQFNMRFIGDQVPKKDEFHIEYFKSLGVKAIKRATHCKKEDVDDICIRLFVEGNLNMGGKYALGLPIAPLKLLSDGIQAFMHTTDK
jgi:hypothetical protein